MKTYTIKCTRCDGTGHFAHYGTCFKCMGEGKELLSEKQYVAYTKNNEKKAGASSYVMFNKSNGAIVKLLDTDIQKASMEQVTIQINGEVVPVSKVELNGESFIAVKWSNNYRLVLNKLVKLFNDKEGVVLTDEQVSQYVKSQVK